MGLFAKKYKVDRDIETAMKDARCFLELLYPLFPCGFRLFVVAVVVKKVLSRKGAFQRLPREDSFCVL